MKKKYYYNGELVRTSDNDYPYGILRGETIVSCCSRYDLAEKKCNEARIYMDRVIASNKKYLQETIEGKHDEEIKKYYPDMTKTQFIEDRKDLINRQEKMEIKIVELERR